MKKLVFTLLIVAFVSGLTIAQDPVRYRIHEVFVMPSKDSQFREAAKKLKDLCTQHKTSFGWTALGYDDGSYIFVAPMTKFADLDNNAFADLQSKIGDEAMGKVWAAIDECTVSARDFIAARLPEFSYMTPPSDEHARTHTFWWPLPGKQAEAEAILREWKKLAESKKSADGYEVYRGGLGTDGPGYVITSWGKDQVDMATKAKKSQELNGDEGQKIWHKTLAITKSYNTKQAWVMPDLSYTPVK